MRYGARLAAIGAVAWAVLPAAAHHGFGRFDPTRDIELSGTITGVDFVNPHAYLYFDAKAADGAVTAMRCEMRAATVLRRSGWTPEMFVNGTPVTIAGNPHRDDPGSCYIDTLKIGDAPTLERYQQLSEAPAAPANRAARTASGEPNIFGDWAQEQYIMARPPAGGRGALVPKSLVAAVESGRLAVADVPNSGWSARPVTLTPAGEAAAEALRNARPEDSPRARCEITSILFDWVFDGTINRITRGADTITIEYGRGLTRTVHMGGSHPSGPTPSRAGHSIGRWDGDTLVVDTVGFAAGIVAGTVPHSEHLHVIERFTLEPTTMALRRDYIAEDSAYFASRYEGMDVVLPADAPFAADRCEELTYRNYAEGARQPQ